MSITHNDLVRMLTLLRPSMSDELAILTLNMFPHWEDYIEKKITQAMIDKGYDRYQYNGHLYKILKPHMVKADLTPDVSPDYWVKLEADS